MRDGKRGGMLLFGGEQDARKLDSTGRKRASRGGPGSSFSELALGQWQVPGVRSAGRGPRAHRAPYNKASLVPGAWFIPTPQAPGILTAPRAASDRLSV